MKSRRDIVRTKNYLNKNVTKVLNVCYNFIKTIDILQNKDKIVIYE